MTEQISSGVELMFAGMGIVFIFLTMLVVSINFMSACVQRFFPERPASKLNLSAGLDKTTVAAITSAVHQYRNRHNQ
ncbi:MAG: OadG family protein [Methyloglobulus sp.]|nr:OadG family protein [Methyloglobulus sp.]